MYCNQCGLNIDDNSRFCAGCGKPVQPSAHLGNISQPNQPSSSYPGDNITTYFDNASTRSSEGGTFWWGVLSFIAPVVGIVLFFVWRNYNKYPRRAKVCLVCGLISIAINIIFLLSNPEYFAAGLFTTLSGASRYLSF